LDYDTVSPQDAVAAVRSFPRRYRALLAPPGSEDRPDAVFRRRPDAGSWSALEHAAYVADVLDHLGPAIRRITVEDNPRISVFDGREGYADLDRTEVLGWLDLAATELASVLAGVRADDWTRTGRLDSGERDALTLARDGVHVGSHRLRDVRGVLDAVRGRRP
jgi:hypothetical protein